MIFTFHFLGKPKDSSHVTQFLWILLILLDVMCLENKTYKFLFLWFEFYGLIVSFLNKLKTTKVNIKKRPSNNLLFKEKWVWKMKNEKWIPTITLVIHTQESQDLYTWPSYVSSMPHILHPLITSLIMVGGAHFTLNSYVFYANN